MAASTDADRIAGILADQFSFDLREADRRDASGGQHSSDTIWDVD